MNCDHYSAGRCRSCAWMGVPADKQTSRLQSEVSSILAPYVPIELWERPTVGRESAFRNKAKLAVGGRRGALTFGIVDAGEGGSVTSVDLRTCGLYEPGLASALPVIADFCDDVGLTPYDIAARTGEFKHLLVTHAPSGQLMVRFVLRSEGQARKLRAAWPTLTNALPQIAVGSINYLREPIPRFEGPEEEFLTDLQTLAITLPSLTLFLRPGGFFQTNTEIATLLYRTAAQWATAWLMSGASGDTNPTHVGIGETLGVSDLYCGIGGFALHIAIANPRVTSVRGIEIVPAAVESATLAAQTNGLADRVNFTVGDATTAGSNESGLVVVNPPRGGIGTGLATAINQGSAQALLYSSCNPATLATDLSHLGNFKVVRAQTFAMFPQTDHCEVLTLAVRST